MTLGTYAGVKFSDRTNNELTQFMLDHSIPKPLAKDKLHTTLLFSRVHCPNYIPIGKVSWVGIPTKYEVFKTRPQDPNEQPKNCLVMLFKCYVLQLRHKHLMQVHGATYDFPEYNSHISLSYDIDTLDISTIPLFDKGIEIVEEYGEDLNLNWI